MWAALAMVAFASNSILCRLALRGSAIDPASFTFIRLASGGVMLLLVTASKRAIERPRLEHHGFNAAMLFLYAIAFSYAYLELSAGTGALILFGAVQATMWVTALLTGERPRPAGWLGFAWATFGLAYLMWPGLAAPSLTGALLMTTAGAAWGVYSLLGRRSQSALQSTAHSFLLAIPLAAVCILLARSNLRWTWQGVALAVCSGAITSALGYVIWYAALRGLSAASAGLVQLTAPVIAAFGGVMFLSESLSVRLAVASLLILGGVTLALNGMAPSGRRS